MSIEIGFYKTTSRDNKLNKEITKIGDAISGSIVDPVERVNPVIVVQLASGDDRAVANYVHIKDFKRYYFVQDITRIDANFVQFTLHVDVLYTYRTYIKSLNVLVERSSNKTGNLNYDDGSLKTRASDTHDVIDFKGGTGFDPEAATYFLTLVGNHYSQT